MSSSKNEVSQSVKSNRLTLMFLFLVFAFPIVSAYTAFFGGFFNRAEYSTVGQLLDPPALIDNFTLVQDSQVVSTETMKKKWWLLYLNDEAQCFEHCVEALTFIRQTHIALGKHASRLERMLVSQSEVQPLADFEDLKLATANFKAGRLDAGTHDRELSDYLSAKKIYLVDPRGFVILEYGLKPSKEEQQIQFKGIIKDIKKLMKFSRIG